MVHLAAPKLLPYPEYPAEEAAGIRGCLVYAIKHYEPVGVACMLSVRDGEVHVQAGDWLGNIIDLADAKHKWRPIVVRLLHEFGGKLVEISSAIKLPQVIFYFSVAPTTLLVDARVSINKFVGPGMLRDVFSKAVPCQEVLAIESYESIKTKYESGIIVKPSRFRCVTFNNKPVPAYVEIR